MRKLCVIDSVWQVVGESAWKNCVKDLCEKMYVKKACVTKVCVKDGVWQSCVWKIVCDKVACVCVKDCACVTKGVYVCVKGCVRGIVCDKVVRGIVCACNIWIDVKLLQFSFFQIAAGASRAQSLPPTKTLWSPSWYMAWSAMHTCTIFQCNGTGLSREPQPESFIYSCPIARYGIQFPTDHCNDPVLV